MSGPNLTDFSTSRTSSHQSKRQNFLGETLTFSDPEEEEKLDMLISNRYRAFLSRPHQENSCYSYDAPESMQQIFNILARCSNSTKCLCHTQIQQIISNSSAYQKHQISERSFNKSKDGDTHIQKKEYSNLDSAEVHRAADSDTIESLPSNYNKSGNFINGNKENSLSIMHTSKESNSSEVFRKDISINSVRGKSKLRKPTNKTAKLNRGTGSRIQPKKKRKYEQEKMNSSATSTAEWTISGCKHQGSVQPIPENQESNKINNGDAINTTARQSKDARGASQNLSQNDSSQIRRLARCWMKVSTTDEVMQHN
ncbi:uncharacterized protein LOC132708134 isoform X2 [Cylas formicarius]|uniref:uncharacterized protein LOC132708134 isoform X2 n=1 Tax=Cylas formicarius TaxID=197179 RepID=UPI002958D059|nr:uncharacterized protein LOC132708134 isoform X2 [Cylas formicarius]